MARHLISDSLYFQPNSGPIYNPIFSRLNLSVSVPSEMEVHQKTFFHLLYANSSVHGQALLKVILKSQGLCPRALEATPYACWFIFNAGV